MRPTILIALLATALSVGCVAHDGPSFFVSNVATPDSDCIYTTDSAILLRGRFNAEFGDSYVVFPIINNQLLGRGGDAPLRADPNHVLITGTVVELQDASGAPINFGALPNPFTVSSSNFVESTDSEDPKQSIGSVQIIPPAYAAALDVMLGDDPLAQMVLIAQLEMFGETVGGVDVEGAPWVWPIDVCQGQCLFVCISPMADVMDENTCECGQNFTCAVRRGDSLGICPLVP